MIRILRYTEYLYLIVAFFAGYRLIELLGTDSQERLIFGFFFVVSVGMFSSDATTARSLKSASENPTVKRPNS